MTRNIVITGLGLLSGYGAGIDALWEGVISGKSSIGPISSFDASGFTTSIASEIQGFKANKVVPKHYRKATKVMARDIALAVGAADAAVKDAGLNTPGIDPNSPATYPSDRTGAQICSMLIAADVDELGEAMVKSRDEAGEFDLDQWGAGGMENITPLWMLKFLPNMQACHVTIIHDSQGPSNTITCAEASSALSLEESCRVIARNAADVCFCGGGDSKLNPMAILRWQLIDRMTTTRNATPEEASRPYDTGADGLVLGEAGAILIVEEQQAAMARDAKIYARVLGHGATQSVHRPSQALLPEPEGQSLAYAIKSALQQAGLEAQDIDVCIGHGTAQAVYDQSEIKALEQVFPEGVNPYLWSSKAYVGNTGVCCGAVDLALGCKMLETGILPPMINCDQPISSRFELGNAPAREINPRHILVYSSAIGGQNAATVISQP